MSSQPQAGRLAFDGVLVLVGGGRVDPADIGVLRHAGAHFVGLDGGADALAAHGITPEAIIGDLDSLCDAEGWATRTKLVRIAEQETTDFEKGLYSTRASVTVGLGMTGGRFDHTLAALDAVTRHGCGRNIILLDESDLALALDRPFRFTVAPGERVSVHPLQAVRFARSTGLLYPLDGLRLAPGERTGTSNSAIPGEFSIVPGEGERGLWLLILPKSYLPTLLAGSGT